MLVGLGKGTPAVLLLTFPGWCFCGHSTLLASRAMPGLGRGLDVCRTG